ncbi:hypothetical protein NP233_g12876 [Leucocoprinus birnbaumii]|uniref:Nephrocystin 3-like N-terminal domain-containing protein n=1 Tax=Leucocoprinus birnbaumii TaxID=56174 RepID=A0AAD5VHT8_9AGAR|nr:hypothetical protein NP233_g12876 [Leucocoprinus birnbaumii]
MSEDYSTSVADSSLSSDSGADVRPIIQQRPVPPIPSPTPPRIRRPPPPPPPPRQLSTLSRSRPPHVAPQLAVISTSDIPATTEAPQLAVISASDIPATTDVAPSQHGQFYKARNFTIKSAHFNELSLVGLGLKDLLKNSMPDAFHDSAARYPPPKCHLGTRKEYIKQITDWALGEAAEHKELVLWMRGPFGIGKTAVAQSSAEALKPINKLLATLFFSRSNLDRDDPRRVFPSIVYQITTLCKQFAIIVDTRIREDLTLTTKSLATQFEELIVIPLSQIDAVANGLEGRVIIIDGLDECRGIPEQCEIIRIITASARNGTTPFRWFITSRPEDPIIRTMNTAPISSVVYRIELPVSRSIDHEILLFLTDEFMKVRESHSLPDSWPSDEVLALLVEHGAGLWIYVATIVRFVNDENSLGPEDQLAIVLRFIGDVSNKVEPNNPLEEMDHFYTLIMQRIPLKIRTIVQKILLIHSIGYDAVLAAKILCLSVEQLRRCCASIQSVAELRGSLDDYDLELHFYHASFMDYLTRSTRSGELCIHGEFLIQCRKALLEWLAFVYSHTTDSSHFIFPAGTTLPKEFDQAEHYHSVVGFFWALSTHPGYPMDVPTAVSTSNIPFPKMLKLMSRNQQLHISETELKFLVGNVPVEFQDKIIQKKKCPSPQCTAAKSIWILGHGDNEVIAILDGNGPLLFQNKQNLSSNQCLCNT